jgi:hypothetical protein
MASAVQEKLNSRARGHPRSLSIGHCALLLPTAHMLFSVLAVLLHKCTWRREYGTIYVASTTAYVNCQLCTSNSLSRGTRVSAVLRGTSSTDSRAVL